MNLPPVRLRLAHSSSSIAFLLPFRKKKRKKMYLRQVNHSQCTSLHVLKAERKLEKVRVLMKTCTLHFYFVGKTSCVQLSECTFATRRNTFSWICNNNTGSGQQAWRRHVFVSSFYV